MDTADDFHASGDAAEGGEALAVGVAFSAVVEFGLIAEAEEEVVLGGVGGPAGHGEGAVEVAEVGIAGAFEGDGGEEVVGSVGVCLGLDDGDADEVGGLVVGGDGAVELAVGVEPFVDVAEEVGGGEGGGAGVEFEFEIAEGGLEEDAGPVGDGFVAPAEVGCLGGVEAVEVGAVGGGTLRGTLVAPGAVAEDLGAEAGDLGVVFLQFGAGIDVVMEGVVFAVVVEPGLDGFGPVFLGVGGGVGAFPEVAAGGVLEGLGEAGVEGGVETGEAHGVDGVGEFVDENVFGGVGVAGEAEQIFLGTTDAGGVGGGAETAGATVPEDAGGEVAVFGDVGGVLGGGHDGEAGAGGGHGLEDVGSAVEQVTNDPGGFAEGEEGEVGGADDGEVADAEVLLVEGVERELLA